MARAGRGGPALATAAIGSFVAALIATIGLAFLAPIIVKVAILFGPWDYFALMLIAFVTVSATFGNSVLRGLTSLAVGLWLGLVGIDDWHMHGTANAVMRVAQPVDRPRLEVALGWLGGTIPMRGVRAGPRPCG